MPKLSKIWEKNVFYLVLVIIINEVGNDLGHLTRFSRCTGNYDEWTKLGDMGSQILFIFCLFVWPTSTSNIEEMYAEFSREDVFMSEKQHDNEACLNIRPTNRDIIKRFYAILPYFDKDHANSAFLRKYRGTVYGMSDGEDLLDKEAAFYAAVLTPLIFLQNYRDTWCLLERFHRALRLYQVSHPTEKRPALKLLQNYRAVNHKIKSFIKDLPGPLSAARPRTSEAPELEEDDLHDKKDIRFVKELVKNLG